MAEPGSERILLTGATGFVGRQVLRNLDPGAEIHCTTREGKATADAVRWHTVDLRDPGTCSALVKSIRPDILIHCAWATDHGSFWHDPQNAEWLEAGKSLFNSFVQEGGRRIIACGSCAEYAGDSAAPRREDEAVDPARIAFPYGRAKFALLEHLRGLDVSYAWVRIFNVFGEGEDPRRLVSSVLRALSAGDPALCSSGAQIRDFLDVRDLGAAIASLAGSAVEGVVNLGSGKPTTIAHVVATLADIVGRPDLIRLGALADRAGETPVLVPEIARQTDELGFFPNIALSRGLADLVRRG